jgi:uncharacterized membrane protein
MKVTFHERLSRSVVKAITFRVIIITADIIIVMAITHQYDITFSVVVGTNVASTLLYLLHERIWNKVHWGKAKK